jgi:hypothetical protein
MIWREKKKAKGKACNYNKRYIEGEKKKKKSQRENYNLDSFLRYTSLNTSFFVYLLTSRNDWQASFFQDTVCGRSSIIYLKGFDNYKRSFSLLYIIETDYLYQCHQRNDLEEKKDYYIVFLWEKCLIYIWR